MSKNRVVIILKTQVQVLTRSVGFRKYFFNTGWLLTDRILALTVNLLVSIYVARYLGAERFGLLNYTVSFVGLFAVLSTLGLNGIIIRELVNNEDKRDQLLGTAFWLKSIGSILLFIVVTIAIPFTNSDQLTKVMVIIIAGGMLFDSFNVINFYFQAKVQSKFVAIASVTAMVISSCLKLGLIYIQADLLWFVVVIVIGKFVLISGYIFYYTKNKLSLLRWRFNTQMAYFLLKDSWPLMLSRAAILIYMNIDQVMIKEILSDSDVGNYAVAVKISTLWYFIPVAINNSLFPAIFQAKKISTELYEKRIQHLFNLMVISSVSITILIFFTSKFVVNFLYGIEYSAAINALKIHAFSLVFVFLNNATWKWHISENNQSLAFFRLFLGALLNIYLNIILLKKYGINGAAIATVISYAFANYFGHLIFKETRPIFWKQTKALLLIDIFNKAKLIMVR